MKKNSRFVIQYSIEVRKNQVEVYNDEFSGIQVDEAIEIIKEKNKGREIDLWSVYYVDSEVLKSKDIKTGKLTFRKREA